MLLQMALFHFLWLSNIPLNVGTTSSLFLHLSMELGSFHFLAIVDSSTVNVGVKYIKPLNNPSSIPNPPHQLSLHHYFHCFILSIVIAAIFT